MAGRSKPIGANTSRVVEGLSVGAHSVDLSGVAANCALSGGARLDVQITASAVTAASFGVTCAPTTGAIAITTTTTGSPIDPDGYDVALDGGATQPIGTAATVTLPGVAAGTHAITLGGLAANCAVAGDNPRSVDVGAGATAAVTIAVTCAPPTPPPAPGGIGVTTQTSGPDQDADGYAVTRRRWRQPADRHRRHAGARRSGTRPAFGGAHRHQRQLPGRRRQPASGGRRLRHRAPR